ncbi:hypothetical protein HAHI6034_11920 [Hathewaya histolytica]|uniref:Uncharacterized protein n=1 Tax=Hathewaya histolytica TaxID=1498 RepID=A0A4U9QWD1_HATHI|nr:hypothetical protein [Hathewaya histolytica]VTQ83114.1 Uncharacterised protein [Hathewaya histolytica]
MKNKKTLIISSVCILILIGVFFSIYYYFVFRNTSIYNKTVKNYIIKINKINNDVNTYSSNGDLDITKINSELSKNVIEPLVNHKNNILKLNPPEKYKARQKYLVDGLENNIMIYKQAFTIINNANNMNLNKSLEDLKSYRDKTDSNYSLAKGEAFDIQFPPTLNTFIDTVLSFGNKSLEKQTQLKIKEAQNVQFKNSVEIAKNKLEDLLNKNSYVDNISRIREENRIFEPVLESIKKDKETLSDIFISLSEIPIPEDKNNIFSTLQSILKDYSVYLQTLNDTLESENNSENTGIFIKKSFENSYTENEKNLENIKNKFNKFKDSLKNI